MKKQIRCPADKTLLATLTALPNGGTSIETPKPRGTDFIGKPSPTGSANNLMFAICPKCRAEVFVGSMPKP